MMPPPYIDPEDDEAVAAYWAQVAAQQALLDELYPPVPPVVWLAPEDED